MPRNTNSHSIEAPFLEDVRPLASLCDAAVGLYWIAITLKSTIFYSAPAFQGMYAPFYPFLVLGALRGLQQRRSRLPMLPILGYYGFILLSILALLLSEVAVTGDSARRIFTYCFGAVAFLNLLTERSLRFLIKGQVVAGAIVGGWVAFTAWTTHFGYRGGIDINWNYVSAVISFGALPMVVYVYDHFPRLWQFKTLLALLVLCLELYGLLLLASRGTAAALAVALPLVVVGRLRGRLLQVICGFVVFAVAFWMVTWLPGGDTLLERGTQDRVESLNFRLPIWDAILTEYGSGSAKQITIGRGLESGEYLVGSTVAGLGTLHNGYLQVLFEEGLIGFSAFVAFQLWCLFRLITGTGMARRLGLMMLAFLMVANLSGSDEHLFEFWIGLAAVGVMALASGRVKGRAFDGPRVRVLPAWRGRRTAAAAATGGGHPL
jgi:O-antigen ligase